MIRLSIDISDVALLRNCSGIGYPDLAAMVHDCERFGADSITLEPGSGLAQVSYPEVRALRPALSTELNLIGTASGSFLALACEILPQQVTLVPDPATGATGLDTVRGYSALSRTCSALKERNVRTVLLIDADPRMVDGARRCGADRIQLNTEKYAELYADGAEAAIAPYETTARAAFELGLGVNAGGALNLSNVSFLTSRINWIDEVTVGHSLFCDSMKSGLEPTVEEYLTKIQNI